MKVLVWCATAEDCRVFEQYNKGRIEFEYTPDTLTEENVSSCKGYEGIVIQTRCMITEKVAALLAEAGVIFIACRSAGFDHVNLAAIKKYGIKACNVPLYSPNAIAEYAVMASMMALRKVKKQLHMTGKGDYTLKGLRGQERVTNDHWYYRNRPDRHGKSENIFLFHKGYFTLRPLSKRRRESNGDLCFSG